METIRDKWMQLAVDATDKGYFVEYLNRISMVTCGCEVSICRFNKSTKDIDEIILSHDMAIDFMADLYQRLKYYPAMTMQLAALSLVDVYLTAMKKGYE